MPAQAPTTGRLISHFEDRETPDHGKAWSDLWDSGESDLWDRGLPSPALIDLIEEYDTTLFYPFRKTESGERNGRKSVLVPGCGRGYDVIALSLHGFDAYGLEISATAISEAQALAQTELASPSAENFGARRTTSTTALRGHGNDAEDLAVSPGTPRFLQGDFFDSSWSDALGFQFDVVYDYTFLCALHPSLRGRWAERMKGLLRPGGLLVCLEFPMYKDPGLPGPPWGVNGVHWELLAGGDSGTGAFTRKLYVQPERTYEVGKGTDMISVYERKRESEDL
ncbi:S-adenosyl-L-methionine-dependent methyltransferase [Aspergillus pseudodeflectus]|uniref:S-adenosyl-L-methionine-dependent methyltransferase n=1 Tax=Aspergillus pseudodeflectus TaxID=176178 RepID=A0ABR4JUD0_9EURO